MVIFPMFAARTASFIRSVLHGEQSQVCFSLDLTSKCSTLPDDASSTSPKDLVVVLRFYQTIDLKTNSVQKLTWEKRFAYKSTVLPYMGVKHRL